MTKALVTGGGGFLGTHICRLLKEKGYDVSSFSRSRYDHLDELNVNQIQGDLSDLNSVVKASEEMTVVFHVASLAGIWGEFDTFFKTNVLGAQNVLDACQKNKIKYLVYTSTPSVAYQPGGVENVTEEIGYPNKYHSDYAYTKSIAERMLLARASESLNIVALRPHLIWGPGDHHFLPRLIDRAKKKKLKFVGSGEALVDHVYVENAAKAHLDAFEGLKNDPKKVNGKSYFLSQDEPIKIKDFINTIFLRVAGLTPVHKKIPFPVAFLVGSLLEFIYRVFKIKGEPIMTRFLAEQLATPHYFDISAAKKDFGYTPLVCTEEGIKRMEKWYQLKGKRLSNNS